MADDRLKKVNAYLRPTLNESPLPNVLPIKEFAEFWRACSEEERTEYAADVPA